MHKLWTFSLGLMLLLFFSAACSLAEGRLPTYDETLAAVATAEAVASRAVPHVEAGMEMAATTAANTYDTGVAAQATLEAAGIDGRYLLDKVRALRPDENGTVTLTLTQTELNLILGAKQLFVEQEGEQTAVEHTQIRLMNGALVLYGTAWERPLTVVFQPYVVDGQVQFNIVSAALGEAAVPAFVVSAAQTTLNGTFNTALAQLPGSVMLRSIVVGDGYLTLTAVHS